MEGAGAGDGGLVGALVGADGVAGAVGVDGAELGDARRARVVVAVVLDNVVLDLGRVDPSIDGQVRAGAPSGVRGGVGDGAVDRCQSDGFVKGWVEKESLPGSTSRPSETDDEVGVAVPVGGVRAGTLVVFEVGGATVVVLDVVDSTWVAGLDLRALSNSDGGGSCANGEQAGDGSGELHGEGGGAGLDVE